MKIETNSLITTKEAAEILNISSYTLARHRREGTGIHNKVKVVKVGNGGRGIRYLKRDILKYIEEREG